jgi:hypothetical protein
VRQTVGGYAHPTWLGSCGPMLSLSIEVIIVVYVCGIPTEFGNLPRGVYADKARHLPCSDPICIEVYQLRRTVRRHFAVGWRPKRSEHRGPETKGDLAIRPTKVENILPRLPLRSVAT